MQKRLAPAFLARCAVATTSACAISFDAFRPVS